MRRFLILTHIIIFSTDFVIQGKILNDSVPPGKNFDKAVFRFWYPDNSKKLGGIIVLMPGYNTDGRSTVNDTFWQDLANKNNLALVGSFFKDHNQDDLTADNYYNVKLGSGQALLDVISRFAKESNHPELSDAPLLLWGTSAGGQFNYEFVCWKPERILAFVVNKGGFYYTALAPKQARDVPGIFFTGENDVEARKEIIKGLFAMNRRLGACWTFAQEPVAGHETGKTQKLAGLFFSDILAIRLPSDNSLPGLQPLPAYSGFIGDLKTLTFSPNTKKQNNDLPTVWLPTSKFAEAWISFIKNEPF